MASQYQRLEMLIGKDGLETLASKRVLIFGLGGVGGHVCDALARSGIKHFAIVDNDKVDITNINRQIIANHNTIGQYKTDAMEAYLKAINPEIEVVKYQMFYLPENADTFALENYDYIVDAIDTVKAKIELICRSFLCKTPIISALGCGNKLDPSQLEITDLSKTSYDPLAKVMRHELSKRGIKHVKVVYSKEQNIKLHNEELDARVPASSAFVPSVAGIMIASEVIKDLLNK